MKIKTTKPKNDTEIPKTDVNNWFETESRRFAKAFEKGKPKNMSAGSCINPAPPPDNAEMKLDKNDIVVDSINWYIKFKWSRNWYCEAWCFNN